MNPSANEILDKQKLKNEVARIDFMALQINKEKSLCAWGIHTKNTVGILKILMNMNHLPVI